MILLVCAFVLTAPFCGYSKNSSHKMNIEIEDSVASISIYPDSGRSSTTFKISITDINSQFFPSADPAELAKVSIDLRYKDGISYYHTHPSIVLSNDSMEAIIAIPDSLESSGQYYLEVASSGQSTYDLGSSFFVLPRPTAYTLSSLWIAEGDTISDAIVVKGAHFSGLGNTYATGVNLNSGQTIIPATNLHVKSEDTLLATFIIPSDPVAGPYALSFIEPGTGDSIEISDIDLAPPGVFYMLVVNMSPNVGVQGKTIHVSITGADAGTMAGIWTFSLRRGNSVILGTVQSQSGSNFSVSFPIPVSADTGLYELIIPLGDFGTGDTVIVPNAFRVTSSSIVSMNELDLSNLPIVTFPNPFSQSTQISFTSDEAGFADISIVNLLGEQIAHLFSGQLDAGQHHFTFSSTAGLPEGAYECLVRMNGHVEKQPIILLH
jgi:hypothetical protein